MTDSSIVERKGFKMNVLISSLSEVVLENMWKISFVTFASVILLSLVLGLIFALINKRYHANGQLRTGSRTTTGHRSNLSIPIIFQDQFDHESGIVNPVAVEPMSIEMRPVPVPRSSLGQRRLRDETPPPSYSKVAVTVPFKSRPCFEAAKRMAANDGHGQGTPSAPTE